MSRNCKPVTAHGIVRLLAQSGLVAATAESCTGGLIAKLITDIPGSSAVFCGGCVTYTNEIKERLLGVDAEIIRKYTEVSENCAVAMAQGVRLRLGADVAVSTTGYAGPGGGTEKDPVGTVYIGVSIKNRSFCERFQASAGATRSAVRRAAAKRALELLAETVERERETSGF